MMAPCDETRSSESVLRIGDAVAVLLTAATDDQDARNAIANAGLRRATGRNDISIRRRSSGRPCLAPPYPELGVSLARRGSLLLAGFSPASDVGVDLELAAQDDHIDAARLAADHFGPDEAAWIAARRGARRADLFLRLWVAKEAVLKLTGRGVYDGLRNPDLGTALDQLERDGRPFRIPSSRTTPAVNLVASRLHVSGATCYGSLVVPADRAWV